MGLSIQCLGQNFQTSGTESERKRIRSLHAHILLVGFSGNMVEELFCYTQERQNGQEVKSMTFGDLGLSSGSAAHLLCNLGKVT